MAAHPGVELPVFDVSRRPKYWEDPAAAQSAEDYVIYPRVLAIQEFSPYNPAKDENGRPFLQSLILPKEVAATVNIPPEVTQGLKLRAPYGPVCKEVPEGLELAWGGALSTSVVLVDPKAKSTKAIAFTQYHEELLEAIAKTVSEIKEARG